MLFLDKANLKTNRTILGRGRLPIHEMAAQGIGVLEKRCTCLREGTLEGDPLSQQDISEMLFDAWLKGLSVKGLLLCSLPPLVFASFKRNAPWKLGLYSGESRAMETSIRQPLTECSRT